MYKVSFKNSDKNQWCKTENQKYVQGNQEQHPTMKTELQHAKIHKYQKPYFLYEEIISK